MATYAAPNTTEDGRENIAPMVTTSWGQSSPYNNMCPTIRAQHCQTGCVATAMAQIMNYHRWPLTTESIPGYASYSYSLNVPALDPVSFAWDKMLDSYTSSATNEEREAVARLMLYCGVSVEMDYGLSTSAAWEGDAARALVNYFGYAHSVREVFRNMYGPTAWKNLIYRELAAGRPVFYGGMPSGFLHQFVCDGYKDGLFHMNMAWSFSANDYYDLDTIDQYPEGQSAIIGIHRADDTDSAYGETFSADGLKFTVIGSETVTVSGVEANFTGHLSVPAVVEHGEHTWTVNTIDYAAFEDSTGITSISLPATVDVIGTRMVLGCTNLESFEVDASNPWYKAEDGVLMSHDGKEMVAYPIDKQDAEYVVPEDVVTLPASFFRSNQHLQQVTLPASLTTLDILTFRGCTSLQKIISNNPSPKAIEDMAFDDETYQTATLVVPQGSANAYRRKDGWKLFQHIVEQSDDETSVLDITPDSSDHVDTGIQTHYNLSGRQAKQSEAGIHIVKTASIVKKVIK